MVPAENPNGNPQAKAPLNEADLLRLKQQDPAEYIRVLSDPIMDTVAKEQWSAKLNPEMALMRRILKSAYTDVLVSGRTVALRMLMSAALVLVLLRVKGWV